jgi:hypothetical protein
MAITVTNVPTGEAKTIALVRSYRTAVQVPTVVHDVIGSGTPDFTVKPAGTRRGTFEFLALDEGEAIRLASFFESPGPFNLADTATVVANTTFMVTGEVSIEVDSQTWKRCLVNVDYAEIS